MPAKIRPDDWDRLFAPDAPRRGGPLAALVHVLVALLLIGLLGAGGFYAWAVREQQLAVRAAAIATATTVAATEGPAQTATAASIENATSVVETATVLALTPTAVEGLGVGVVISGGNLRSEPRIADDTQIGLIWPGDQIVFLEELLVGGTSWFRIRVIAPAPDRAGEGVPADTEGWASGTLLSSPTPAPAP